jgi:two-component system nitrate/nitrite response regulator NarL
MANQINGNRFIEPHVHTNADGTDISPGFVDGKIVTLLVATPHEIAGAGIAALLQAGGYRVVAYCLHEDDLLRCVEAYQPSIVMLAESVVGRQSAKTISRIRAYDRPVSVIFLLEERDTTKVVDFLDVDVQGILLNWASARSLIDCVESVARGRKWIDPELMRCLVMAGRRPQAASSLTARESDIAQLVSQGLRNKEIARQLHLSEGTVKMHLHHIYEKLGVGGRTRLALSMTAM